MSHNAKQGLYNNVRSPASIANAEHYDPAGSGKNVNASPATIKQVVASPTSLTPVHNFAVVRVANTTGSTVFFWAGRIDQAPATPDVTNSLAIPGNSAETFVLGASDDDALSMAIKGAGAGLQIVIMQE